MDIFSPFTKKSGPTSAGVWRLPSPKSHLGGEFEPHSGTALLLKNQYEVFVLKKPLGCSESALRAANKHNLHEVFTTQSFLRLRVKTLPPSRCMSTLSWVNARQTHLPSQLRPKAHPAKRFSERHPSILNENQHSARNRVQLGSGGTTRRALKNTGHITVGHNLRRHFYLRNTFPPEVTFYLVSQ